MKTRRIMLALKALLFPITGCRCERAKELDMQTKRYFLALYAVLLFLGIFPVRAGFHGCSDCFNKTARQFIRHIEAPASGTQIQPFI